MHNNIVLSVVLVTTAEEKSTTADKPAPTSSCVYVCDVLPYVSFSKWIWATHVRGVGVKARTHARTYARRRGGNNSRVIVLVPMLADKTSNVQRRVRAGAAATDENIIMCLEIGTPYAVTTRFLQLPTFIPAKIGSCEDGESL